jgi:phosphoribosylaminoimidazolecarboxamide formyltransferase/IMP cyclohydrolase
MTRAFNHTADYDAVIATTMDMENGERSLRLAFEDGTALRYGENSHQCAHVYRQKGTKNSLYDHQLLNGKKLSFNNILDMQAALDAIRETPEDRTACSVVKHNNPCGLAEGNVVGNSQREVLELAWAGDPVSAFGSIIAFNDVVGLDTVEFFDLDNKQKRKFFEVIIAPDFDPAALEYLKQSKNLRVVKYDVTKMRTEVDYRFMNGSLLEQTMDDQTHSKMDLMTKTGYEITEIPLIEFGLRAIKAVKSNSILLVRRKGDCYQLLGMGAGQPNRIISTQLAIEKAQLNDPKYDLSHAWMISDAFFPFPDCVEYAHEKGIRKVVQPGGSIKDKLVIQKCNELGVSMVLTGLRHFKH